MGINTALALVDPAVCRNADPTFTNLSFAKAYKVENGRHAAMEEEVLQDGSKASARMAWNEYLSSATYQDQAVGMVFADLRAKAASGMLFENLDPARRTAVDALGGAAVFGFGTAAAGATGDIILPGPSAAAAATADAVAGADAIPAWWCQAYAEQQEKNR